MKRHSILTRINIGLIIFGLSLIILTIVQLVLSSRVNEVANIITKRDIPIALNSLAMLEELGDMNSNLLEYVLGEQEEKQEYFGNAAEFEKFRKLLPDDEQLDPDYINVDRLVAALREEAETNVFNIFNPVSEKNASVEINRLIRDVGKPLELLLDNMKEEEILDVGSANDPQDIINDDLPGVRYYLELTDEAGDMLADLDRFVLGDIGAKRSFFSNALQFETFLVHLKPLEQKPAEIIKIREIERLFNELKEGGQEVFDNYQVTNKLNAQNTIDRVEHQLFKEAETLLDNLSTNSRRRVETALSNLTVISKQVNFVLVAMILGGTSLMLLLIFYMRRSLLLPIINISNSINRLRQGDRNIVFEQSGRNDEVNDINNSLALFQTKLIELDSLRVTEQEMQQNLTVERDKLSIALNNLQTAQDQLVANEKLASLGSLVAGVAHEINTPIGVSVTLASHLNEILPLFIATIKTGELNQSTLDKFEKDSIESLSVLNNSLEKAGSLIQNFKQIAVDQTSSKRRKFNLRDILDDVINTLKHQVRSKSYSCNISGPDDLIMDSFPGPLGQVITNLFNNAVLHGFADKDKGVITINYQVINTVLQVYFKDNGNGIKKQNLSRLFDPFFTTRLGAGSSGLGLHIVHNIITGILGGEISVTSEEGKGTTFLLNLPIIAPYKEK